jgi:hypothetical protein
MASTDGQFSCPFQAPVWAVMCMVFHVMLQVGFLRNLLPIPTIPDQPHAPATRGLPGQVQDNRLT